MTAPVHYAAGALSALLVPKFITNKPNNLVIQSIVALGLSILSHVILDLFEHSHYRVNGPTLMTVLVLETMVMAVILLSIPTKESFTAKGFILIGMFGAAIPDVAHIAILHVFHGKIAFIYLNNFAQFILSWLFLIGVYKIK
ncbi:MAG: hypothetical protein A3J46_06570 [Candidatus Yanofskybacteria bacterium RIFCSPHIGHO2_02_FULL_41_11]|uniref:Uncharacterized protein n=1 Tax=Candidatus Yanofskybacteria bacterium RIFCSPHIGHO2_02_FULL_41_11 TaxID=1802675 RepID=A0A1F8F6C0_9BACT|nr:MAG: hypothetical protein A3J46_06570 [Candidatus Yanofskybacteria bacterium RIFCSPHIGHO2_02_FULL_41_11]